MLDKLQLPGFANHHHHLIRIEECLYKRRFFFGGKHFKTLQLETVKMPEPSLLKFFLHQKMYPGRYAVNIMKFEPGNFFIQHQIVTQVAIYEVGYGPRHIPAEKFFRNQIAFGEIIYKKNLCRMEPA